MKTRADIFDRREQIVVASFEKASDAQKRRDEIEQQSDDPRFGTRERFVLHIRPDDDIEYNWHPDRPGDFKAP